MAFRLGQYLNQKGWSGKFEIREVREVDFLKEKERKIQEHETRLGDRIQTGTIKSNKCSGITIDKYGIKDNATDEYIADALSRISNGDDITITGTLSADSINASIKEEEKMSNAKEVSTVEKAVFVMGIKLSTASDDQLITLIEQANGKKDYLSGVNDVADSMRIKDKIEELEEAIDLIVVELDSRE